MAISSVTTAQTANQSAALKSLTEKTVTQDDFLRLLIAQLQNQDPLQPMDNQEFAAQLATFNSLGQLIDINDKLGAMQIGQSALSQYNATSLIGKEISSAGNLVSVKSGGSAPLGFQLGANATKTTVSVFDASGTLIRQLDAGSRQAGEHTFTWDGKDGAGRTVASGVYSFEVTAADLNGRRIPAVAKLHGVVTGVNFDGSEPLLEVAGVNVPLSAVTSVRAAR